MKMETKAKEYPVTFTNKRGHRLFGVLHIPQGIKNPPVLVMCHGFTDDKVCDNRLFVRFARRAREEGFAVLRFDFAGSGDSEGEFADMTVTGEIQDLESAIGFVNSVPGLVRSPNYLVGYSLGGAVALSAAARSERVKGFVGWSPASDLLSVFYTILGKEAFISARRSREVTCENDSKYFLLKPDFFSDLKNHHPANEIAKVSPRPVLLVQGTADTKVLPEQTQLLYEAAEEPKKLHVIEGAPHSFAFHEDELFKATLRHLRAWIAQELIKKKPENKKEWTPLLAN